jgi:hypothetical protein
VSAPLAGTPDDPPDRGPSPDPASQPPAPGSASDQPPGFASDQPPGYRLDQPVWVLGQPVQPIDPAAAPAGAGQPWLPPADPRRPRLTPRGLLIEVLTALGVAAAVAALGAPLGLLWSQLSPRVRLVMTESGPAFAESNPEGYVAGESVYLLLALAMGVLSAIAVWLLIRRRRGPVVLAGLATGSFAGALLMSWLGHRIGLAEYERLLHGAPVGTRFERPVKLLSDGAVAVQAIAAVGLYTLMAGFYATPSLRPEPGAWYPHGWAPASETAPAPDAKRSGGSAPAPVSSGWSAPPDHPAEPAPPAGG